MISQRLLALTFVMATALFTIPTPAQALDPSGGNFTAYCDVFMSVASVAGTEESDRGWRENRSYMPSCMTVSDEKYTHHLCSCGAQETDQSIQLDSAKLFPGDATVETKLELLKSTCTKTLHNTCGPLAPRIRAECHARGGDGKCTVTATPHDTRINRYHEFEVACEIDTRLGWAVELRTPDDVLFSQPHAMQVCERVVERETREMIPNDLLSHLTVERPSKMRVSCNVPRPDDEKVFDACVVDAEANGASSSCVCNRPSMSEERRDAIEVWVPMDLPAMHALCRQEVAKCRELPTGFVCRLTPAPSPMRWMWLALFLVASLRWRRRRDAH